MSILQMVRVWEHEFPHPEQAVMLALADHAADDGTSIRPSINRIAWKTGYGRRNVQLILKRLKESGILVTHRGATSQDPAEYHFDWSATKPKQPFAKYIQDQKNRDEKIAPPPESRDEKIAPQGRTTDRFRGEPQIVLGVICGSPDPSIEPSFKPSTHTPLNELPVENSAVEVCVCEENDSHSPEIKSAQTPPVDQPTQQPQQLGGYQGWGAPPPLAVDDAEKFIEIYNRGRPETWAIAIPHPGRSNTLRQFTASVNGSTQAQELLKLALAHLHLNPSFYVHPNRRSGQQHINRNLDWLLKTPRDGGPPHLLKFAEAAQTAGVNADALIDAAASGLDIQAAKKEFEHKASGLADQMAKWDAEREERRAENDRIWAAALAEQDRQRQERYGRAECDDAA